MRIGRSKVRGRYRLHLYGIEHSLEGLVVAITAGHYRLLDACILTKDGTQALSGQIVVPERNVQFLQQVG